MPRTRRAVKRRSYTPETSSDEDETVNEKKKERVTKGKKKVTPIKKAKIMEMKKKEEDSSSESDIEAYLKPVDEIDLNSETFMDIGPKNLQQQSSYSTNLEDIENNIFGGVRRLSTSSSSESENLEGESENKKISNDDNTEDSLKIEESDEIAPKINFQQLQEFTNKIEEAKKSLEAYQAKKQSGNASFSSDVSNLLAEGEMKGITLTESDFMSLDSDDEEKEDWEEVENHKIAEKSTIPKEGVQITLELPNNMKKKKGVDLMTAMKRAMNRIVKENQVFVHKVHLLCWLAHGNNVNKVLSNETILGLALSLIPSQNCYPSDRIQMSYLEQLLQWFRKAINLKIETQEKSTISLEEQLKEQITKKEASSNKMLVYIFVSILRALGINCRLVLSFRVAPLRPDASKLHSLSTKKEESEQKQGDNKASSSKIIVKSKENNTSNEKEEKSKSKHSKKRVENKSPQKSSVKEHNKEIKKSDRVKKDNKQHKKEGSNVGKNVKDSKKDANKKEAADKNKIKAKVDDGKKSINKPTFNLSKFEHFVETLNSKSGSNEDLSCIPSVENLLNQPKSSSSSSGETSDSRKSTKSNKSKPNLKGLSLIKKKKQQESNKNIPQTDGPIDSDSDEDFKGFSSYPINFISQLDGGNDDPKNKVKKPNLSKLRLKTNKSKDKDVGEESEIRSPLVRKNSFTFSTPNKASTSLNKTKQQQEKSQKESSKSSSSKQDKKQTSKVDKNKKTTTSNLEKRVVKATTTSASSSSSPKKLRNTEEKKRSIDIRQDIMALMTNQILTDREKRRKQLVKTRKHVEDSDEELYISPKKKKQEDSDEEFTLEKEIGKSKIKPKVKPRVVWKKQREEEDKIKKEDDSIDKGRKGIDLWIEVFLEEEEKWISVDVIKKQVHCVTELHNRATHPISYIVAWDNNSYIKDITKRYCPNWNTVTRKLRVDQKWWDESLAPFKGPKTRRDIEEDEDLARMQLDQPLPKTINEYKNHPLYVLQRHLLKFEAIYPPDALTLGFVRNEPVYSRQCVYTLHSREIWLKEAKVVKPGEKPYKIVKARPKYDKLSNSMITDQLLEIFGPWQVQDYEPPTAENGVIPRNAYGNVELYKPCMLPKGTVHLQLPGLNKVAKKMNIDCAPAMVGFEFHSGWNHPMFDGFIVCEEYAEQITAAWYLEQEEAEKRAQDKIEKRVYGNWRRLIKGLLIRERLKARYDFGNVASTSSAAIVKKKATKKIASSSSSSSDEED